MRFDHPQHWVELAWDPYDVSLGVRLDGIALEFLRTAAGLPAPVQLDAGVPLLRAVAQQVAQLLAHPALPALLAKTGSTLHTLQQGGEAALVALLQSTEPPAVRVKAATGLGELGTAAPTAVAALAGALADPDASVRVAAADALYHVGAHAPEVAAPALARGVTFAALSVRRESLLALRQLGPSAGVAAEAIADLLGQGLAAEAVLATQVLLAVRPERARVAIRALMHSPRKRDRDRSERLQKLIDALPQRLP